MVLITTALQKPENSDAFNALTFNENVLSNPSKYGIQWTYNLTVYNLEPQDAGLYRCTAGGVDYDAILTVVGKNSCLLLTQLTKEATY